MGCHPAARGAQLTDLPDDLLCHVLSLMDPAGTHAATPKEWHQLVLVCRAFARCLPACTNAQHTINSLEELQGLLVAGLAGRLTVPVSYLRLERNQPCDEVMCLFCGTSSRCSRSGLQHTGVLGLLKHPEALQILEMPYIFSAKAQVRPATEWLPRFSYLVTCMHTDFLTLACSNLQSLSMVCGFQRVEEIVLSLPESLKELELAVEQQQIPQPLEPTLANLFPKGPPLQQLRQLRVLDVGVLPGPEDDYDADSFDQACHCCCHELQRLLPATFVVICSPTCCPAAHWSGQLPQ